MVATSVACLFALIVASLLSLRIADVVIAYAPGGMEAMTILAFVLHLDPAFVGVHQLARFLFVALAMPFAVAAVRAHESRTKEEPDYSAAIARLPNGNSSRCHTSTSASASASISLSS